MGDLKSFGPQGPCGFESRPGHQLSTTTSHRGTVVELSRSNRSRQEIEVFGGFSKTSCWEQGEMARVVGRVSIKRELGRTARRPSYRKNPATLAQDVTEGVLKIIDGSTIFHLSKPIDLTVQQAGPYILISYDRLGIQECGRTKVEALDAFAYHFGALWEQVAEADDVTLTGDARQIKRAMWVLVESVDRQS